MNLRTRIIIICSLILALEAGLFFIFFQWDLTPKIFRLEKSYVEKDLSRNMELLQRELYHMERTSQLISILDPIKNTEQAKQIDSLMIQQDLNLLYIIDNNNLVLFGKIIDLSSMTPFPNEKFLSSLWKEKPQFLKPTADGQSQMGIYNSLFGPMLLVSTPILRENKITGTLIIGKILTREMIQLMRNITFTSLSLWPLEGATLGKKHLETLRALSETDSNFLVEQNEYAIRGYVSLADINQANNILLSTDFSRDIQHTIRLSWVMFIGFLILLQIVFMFVLYWVITRRANNPIHALIQELDKHHDNIETITFSQQSWGELDPLVQSLSNFLANSQQHVNKQNTLAYQQGLYFADQSLFHDLDAVLKPLISGLEDIEQEWLSLPTDSLEWILAECKARKISEVGDPFQRACFQKLSEIHHELRKIQKKSYQNTLKLHHEALRSIMVLRRRAKKLVPSFDFPRMTRS